MDCDALSKMFERQDAFQKRLGFDFSNMWYEERTAFIKEHSIHLNQEVNEALYELPFFKPWKDYSGMSNEEAEAAFNKFVEEMIDAWHFFMNMLLAAKVTPERFYAEYIKKNQENHRRQDEGYTYDKNYRKGE